MGRLSDTLLSNVPVSRRTDFESSKRAEAEINASGVRATQQRQVLVLVQRYPGFTSREIAHKSGLDRYMVARRLPELREASLVISPKHRMRTCGIGKRQAVTWWPR